MILLGCLFVQKAAIADSLTAETWPLSMADRFDSDSHMSWIVETGEPLQPETVLRGSHANGQPLDFVSRQEAIARRDAENALWVRWVVANDLGRTFDGLLVFARGQFFKANLYASIDDRATQSWVMDVQQSRRDVAFQDMLLNYPLFLLDGEQIVFALRLPTLALPGELRAFDSVDYHQQSGLLEATYALFIGILAGMAIYQAVLSWIMQTERSHSSILFILVVIWFILVKSGMLFIFDSHAGNLIARFGVFAEAAMLSAAMYFARDALTLRSGKWPRLSRLTKLAMIAPIVVIPVYLFHPVSASMWLRAIAPLIVLMILGIALYLAIRRRNVMAYLVLTGWIPIILGGILYLASAFDMLRTDLVLLAVIDVLFMSGVVIFSMGVSWRLGLDRQNRMAALQSSEERYELAMEGSKEGLFDWDLETDNVYASRRAGQILGHEEIDGYVSAKEWRNLLDPVSRDKFLRDLNNAGRNLDRIISGEYALTGGNDRRRHIILSASIQYNAIGKPRRLVGSVSDVTDRHKMEEQLRFSALHDQLTNLPNRGLLMDRIDVSILRHKRDKNYHFGLLFIDLDRFKSINDSLGHTVGDAYLIAVAHRLEESLRAVDTLARWGGDEFVILVEALEQTSDARLLAKRIEATLKPNIQVAGHELSISASIGVITSDIDFDSADTLLRDADLAMYAAKEAGRGRVMVFDESMRDGASHRLAMEARLKQAIERKEFELHYQPIFVLTEEPVVTGFEALIRWRKPEDNSLVPPNEFLPLAEENGLIREIGSWALEEAVRQMADWARSMDREDLYVNVNVSAVQLDDESFVDHVLNVLEETQLPVGVLRLEIVESTVIENPEVARKVLERLDEAGVRIVIDDFGTGYSSLGYLNSLPFRCLKIDRSFVDKIHENSEDRAIVSALVSLAGKLGLEVVAEGIETRDQYNVLASLGCDLGQGFLVSRPLTRDQVAKLIAEDNISALAEEDYVQYDHNFAAAGPN